MQGTAPARGGPNFELSLPCHLGYRMKGLHWHKLKQIFNYFYDV